MKSPAGPGKMPSTDIAGHHLYKGLVNEDRTLARNVAEAFLQSSSLKAVSMADVLASKKGKLVMTFHNEARGRGSDPSRSYADILAHLDAIGIAPEKVINFTEDEWNQNKHNRHSLASYVTMNCIKHLQVACAECGRSFEGYRADEMNDIHFDHRNADSKSKDGKSANEFRMYPS